MKSQRIIIPSESLDYTFVFAEENLTNYAQGTQGLTGANGSQGPQGDVGANGLDGATGSQGPQGATGATGIQGPQGDIGANGLNGSDGSQGPQGDIGATGGAGSQGPQGNVGATGSQGSQGDTGATGGAGSQGPQGATGAQGPEGSGARETIIRLLSDEGNYNQVTFKNSALTTTLSAGNYQYELILLVNHATSAESRYRFSVEPNFVVANFLNTRTSEESFYSNFTVEREIFQTATNGNVVTQERGLFRLTSTQTITVQYSLTTSGGSMNLRKGSIWRIIRTA